ncbi:uncharacterized protein PHALS_10184 [Plasmopara halstedii]|uniref:Uncharacterized protein n=1 Tax=Plasmopara halstedii TaxID=4781 RepID=A0A0P1AGA8_PLAHL|nr:uncharacterized protein PHALS_10184 [Plasmopara halstedii]CEG39959.1 hypothetical protein PHALS_10184 [Plasmopara halstedii]|eukprot:XP_024576328.1 hypothetical protein PHALS_10184 [Plasmopara halstedii]
MDTLKDVSGMTRGGVCMAQVTLLVQINANTIHFHDNDVYYILTNETKSAVP